jgi:crotonobetainyl-CoA:carnitine CoA-transferase CaiB-like acyl-CoA transferase
VADLGSAFDRARLLALVERADVFVESWAPGVGDGLGLGDERLRRRNPALVHCSITGFGDDGPLADAPAHEGIVHALVGTMAEQQGHREGPIFQGLPFAAIGAGYLAVIGIFSALHRRAEDGAGRHVRTSLLDGALAYHSMLWGESDASVEAMARLGATLPDLRQMTVSMRLITRSYECADHEYIGIHTGAVGAFGRLMKVLGLDDRIPPSETGMDIGVPLTDEQRQLINDEVPRIFATRPRAAWVASLLDADVCAVEHLRPTDVYDTPQAQHNSMVVDVDDPVLGRVQQVAPAAKFSVTPAAAVFRPAPTAGRDTEEAFAPSAGGLAPAAAAVNGDSTRPVLAGVRVLDLGAYYAGPYSSRLLADLGADVIKVEPVLGDQLRGIERPFYSAQAGKRAMAANLKDPGLQRALQGLFEWADVLHHNLRPGAAERLGVDYESVRRVKPDIVYLYAPGWGSSGPFRMRQSFAPMLSGYIGATYEVAGQYNPPLPPIANEDPGNGLLGAAAILMALLHRQRTGQGQYVENPQLNATMAHLAHIVRRADGEVIGAGRLDPLQVGLSPYERLYETSDGWVCVSALTDRDRTTLAKLMGVDFGDDDDTAAALADAFAGRATEAVASELRDAGVAVAVPVGRNNHNFMTDPENRRTGRVAERVHPTKGRIRELAALVRVSDTAVAPHRLAPELGEHTDEILSWLGYRGDEIADLRRSGAIR